MTGAGDHPSTSAQATEGLGESLASLLRPGAVLLLEGQLASGKTTLVRGLVRGLGGDPDEVVSPSFVLLLTYPCGPGPVLRLHHVDLYRLADEPRALREIGLEEVLSDPDAVVAVEWPRERALDWLPTDAEVWRVRIERTVGDHRRIEIDGP
jgi:tRNA threonylcarbamoyladenosine biosynthesis protein TsaE